MALTINITNNGTTTSGISLFSSGASGDSNFINFPNGFQAVDTSNQITSVAWSYLGNGNWITSSNYTVGYVLFNIQTNAQFNVSTNVLSGLTPAQVSAVLTASLISQGYPDSVVAVSLSFDALLTPIITYNISNPQFNFTDVRQTKLPFNYFTPTTPTNNLSVLASNPNVTSQQSVPLDVIQRSTTGYSYLIKSMYATSPNQDQLLKPITYGYKDANGQLQNEILANVFDPYSGNSVAIRSKGMNNFIFDDSSVFQFDVLPETNVSIKYEFEQLGYDEIKKQAIGVELRKRFAQLEMENQEKADDFQNFYFFE
jgi:hypothetical protein